MTTINSPTSVAAQYESEHPTPQIQFLWLSVPNSIDDLTMTTLRCYDLFATCEFIDEEITYGRFHRSMGRMHNQITDIITGETTVQESLTKSWIWRPGTAHGRAQYYNMIQWFSLFGRQAHASVQRLVAETPTVLDHGFTATEDDIRDLDIADTLMWIQQNRDAFEHVDLEFQNMIGEIAEVRDSDIPEEITISLSQDDEDNWLF